jgi:hypothetical protein
MPLSKGSRRNQRHPDRISGADRRMNGLRSSLRGKIASNRPRRRWQVETEITIPLPIRRLTRAFNTTNHARRQPVMAGSALRGLERYLCRITIVDADCWQDAARADALAQSLMARHPLRIAAWPDHIVHTVRGPDDPALNSMQAWFHPHSASLLATERRTTGRNRQVNLHRSRGAQ